MSDFSSRPDFQLPRAPLAGLFLLRLRFRGDVGEALIGDLLEEYSFRATSEPGGWSARAWFLRQTFGSIFSRLPRRGMGILTERASDRSGSTASKSGDSHRRPGQVVDNLIFAIRQAIRNLVRRPLITLVSVCTLALGIGASTIIFSVTYNIMFRPLPFPVPQELVGINRLTPEVTGPSPSISTLNNIWMTPFELYLDWDELSTSFTAMGAYAGTGVTLTGEGDAVRLYGIQSTSGVFAALGTEPALGRILLPEDDEIGAAPVVLLSHGTWRNRFGADPEIIGQAITLNGTGYIVVGVLPGSFSFASEYTAVWFTFSDEQKTSPHRAGGYLKVIARLKQNVTIEMAQAEMDGTVLHLGEVHPEEKEHGIRLTPYHRMIVSDSGTGLVILIGAVIMILLISCANIAGLLLVRAVERRRELAIRAALGAGRRHLVMQSLGESLLLSVLGGILGLLITFVGLRPFVAIFPGGLPPTGEIRVDTFVLIAALLISILVGLVIGFVPAVRTARIPAMETIRQGSSGRNRNRTQAGLVVAQVTLAFALLAGAGLFVKSFQWLLRVDPGFDTQNLIIMDVVLPDEYRNDDSERAFFTQLFERLETLPGMVGVAAVEQVPMLTGLSYPPAYLETTEGTQMVAIHRSNVTPSYFEVMDIPILSGRGMTDTDIADSPAVAVVNRAMAERYWPEEDPIGRRINLGSEEESLWITIVGVAADILYRPQGQPFPEYYISTEQDPQWYLSVLMKTSVDPLPLAGPARETVQAIDPNIPITVSLFDDLVRSSYWLRGPRIGAWSFSILGLVAALLTVMGLYGMLAFMVVRQTREIGIRIALGADRARVIRNVLGRGIGLVAVGLLLGLSIAIAAGGVLESVLFGIRPADPVTLVEVGLLVTAAGLAASWLPARRATAVDPIRSLNQE